MKSLEIAQLVKNAGVMYGVGSPKHKAFAEKHGVCYLHPAYTPDNCPVCGTATEIGR